jgi:EAL domain-containing protein (putative c-di-GMP-specific phosphodiesterase class I)
LVNFATGEITSFEALLRWRHPERGLMPPDAFIPLMEETGLVVPIGGWVMRAACKQAATWPSHISVAVNVSTKQFCDPSLIATVEGALRDTGFCPTRLELEITESALMTDTEQNLAKLDALRKMGLRIALDDFGTGFSSLSYLQMFDFHKLKIDKSFVQGLNVKPKSKMLVSNVINMAKDMGMKITAEGVETMDQYRWLGQECQEAQGHLISQALPAEDVHEFIANFEGPGPVAPLAPKGTARIRLVS